MEWKLGGLQARGSKFSQLIVDQNDKVVCEVVSEYRGYSKTIAAAHDMLAALEEMLANTENRQDEPFVAYVRATCKAAIDAAK